MTRRSDRTLGFRLRASWDSPTGQISPLSAALRDAAGALLRMYPDSVSGKKPRGAWLVGSRIAVALRLLPDAPSSQYARDLLQQVRHLAWKIVDPAEDVHEVMIGETIAELLQLIRREDTDVSRAKPEGVLGGGVDDPVEESLTGQMLKLYRFLRPRKHWTACDTLRSQADIWRRLVPEDQTIYRALHKLQLALTNLEAGVSLEISDCDRRCRLA